jgi:hypothetical protein
MDAVESILDDIKTIITNMQQKRDRQLINWGIGIITSLISVVCFLTWHLITKTP